MEEGRQKSKRLSYTAKFKREVIRCAEEKGNRKAAAIFGINESNVRLWRNHNAAIGGCEASRRKFSGPKKGRFPEIDDALPPPSPPSCTRSHIKTTRYSLREQTATKPNSSPHKLRELPGSSNLPKAGDSNFIKINTLNSRKKLIHSYQLGSSPGAF